jgi:hypothetical protein
LVAFVSFCGVCGTFDGTGSCGDSDDYDDSDDSDDSDGSDGSDNSGTVGFRFGAMAGGRAGVLDGIWKVASITLEEVEVAVGIQGNGGS